MYNRITNVKSAIYRKNAFTHSSINSFNHTISLLNYNVHLTNGNLPLRCVSQYIHHRSILACTGDFLTPLNTEHSINSAMRKGWTAAAFLCWTVCGLSSSQHQTHMARWLCSLSLSVRRRVVVRLPARLWGWGRDGGLGGRAPLWPRPRICACLLGDRRHRSAPLASFFRLHSPGTPYHHC